MHDVIRSEKYIYFIGLSFRVLIDYKILINMADKLWIHHHTSRYES